MPSVPAMTQRPIEEQVPGLDAAQQCTGALVQVGNRQVGFAGQQRHRRQLEQSERQEQTL